MADIFCQKCGKANPPDQENCEFCGAPLPPPPASGSIDSQQIKVGQDPVKIDTSVFEKRGSAQGDPMHAGEAPTKKDTAELEETLPAWLRALREGKDKGEYKSADDAFPEKDFSQEFTPPAGPGSFDVQPDWLSGLGKGGSDDREEIPGWLTSLGIEKPEFSGSPPPSPPQPAPKLTGSLSPGMVEEDWDARLGNQVRSETLETKPLGDGQGEEIPPESTPPETAPLGDWQGGKISSEFAPPETAPLSESQGEEKSSEYEPPKTAPLVDSQMENEAPDWFSTLRSEPAVPETRETLPPYQDDDLHEWLSDIPDSSGASVTPSDQVVTPASWRDQLKEEHPDIESPSGGEKGLSAGPVVPDWLSNLRSTTGTPQEAPGEIQPDWLTLSETKKEEEIPSAPTASGEVLPDWLSNVEPIKGPEPATSDLEGGEHLPEWLSGAETQETPQPAAPSPSSTAAPAPAADEIPKWLSQFQADVDAAGKDATKESTGKTQPAVKRPGTGPLPDWLIGIEKGATPSGGVPALISSDQQAGTDAKGGEAFSMEMPDWLSKLKPEQTAEKTPEGTVEPGTPANLEVSQLPTWVQAMRPVESVVPETGEPVQEDVQVTEQSGPLAGLLGVLPVSPGLGQLRKPPAYSPLLQVTDGQQRHATSFEKLISGENQPVVASKTRLVSNRLWRWLIAGFLVLAVAFPLITGIPATQAGNLQPPEMESAFNIISNLPSNAPVLVVFDYDPALSGELEAAAAPLMDDLLTRDPRLVLISTNPTGPVLAEHLLHDASDSDVVAGHNYQVDQQYVNLGYLAGGPSGVQFLASSPMTAAPFTVDGREAWQLPPLQGVQALSDFATIIVLTDNADSGRTWLEQTGSRIGTTPILMVISAQAEPMMLPYYDSGQIKGLVTGLVGGEYYGQVFVRPDAKTGPAQRYWSSFSAGTLAAEILIIIGTLWNAIAGWGDHRKKTGKRF